MPSSSARCSQLPRAEDKLPFYVGLRKLRDFVNGTLHSLNEAEITFPDIKIKDKQKTLVTLKQFLLIIGNPQMYYIQWKEWPP